MSDVVYCHSVGLECLQNIGFSWLQGFDCCQNLSASTKFLDVCDNVGMGILQNNLFALCILKVGGVLDRLEWEKTIASMRC